MSASTTKTAAALARRMATTATTTTTTTARTASSFSTSTAKAAAAAAAAAVKKAPAPATAGLATTRVLPRAFFTTTAAQHKSAVETAKEKLKEVDRAVSDKLVDGINMGGSSR